MLSTRLFLASIFLLIAHFFVIGPLFSQETDVLMTNSRPIKKDRYKDVLGSPYIYDEWQTGKIISVNADVIEGVKINFNGETNGFEIKNNNSYIELDPKWYIRVIINGETPEEDVVFQKHFLK